MKHRQANPAHPPSAKAPAAPALLVVAAGLHTSRQGAGRPGRREFGVPAGGAADRAALALGNALVGNPPAAPALEITLVGPTLRALADVGLVVFGAPFQLRVADRPIPAGRTFTLRAGETLAIGGTRDRVRACVCLAGGGAADVADDQGRPIPLGERIPAGAIVSTGSPLAGPIASRWLADEAAVLDEPTAAPSGTTLLRVLPGPHADRFRWADFGGIRNADPCDGGARGEAPGCHAAEPTWRVQSDSDRMGVRLAGPSLPRTAEIASEPVVPGTVQIAGDGCPIVLGPDAQTIGGYPKIAGVIAADLDRVGRLRPGASVRFVQVTSAEAEASRERRAVRLRRAIRSLRG